MAGIIGIVLGYAQIGGAAVPFWLAGALGLLLAAYFAWRDAFREAHPYDMETLVFARRHWAQQPIECKGYLRRLLVEKRLVGVSSSHLDRCAFVSRDFQGAYTIVPEFEKALAKVMREDVLFQ